MMKHNESLFRFYDDKITFLYKKTESDIFAKVYRLSFVSRRFSVSDKLNVIGVCRERYSELQFDKMLLINGDTGENVNVSLALCDNIGEDEFVATSYLKEMLGLEASENIYLCRYKDFKYKQIYPQKIDHIRESDLVMSEYDYNELLCDIKMSPCKLFEIYNSFSHDSIVVKKSHIFVDSSLAPGTIRLSRKQRICLGLELPLYLSDKQWTVLSDSLDRDGEDFQTITELYASNDHVLDKSASYDKKTKAKKIISKYCSGDIRIIPVPDSVDVKRKKLSRRLCDFYVGKSTIFLVGRRPYDIDEGLDIVRMTRSNMNLLGIDEMDKVILQYKNRKISCRVLELSDEAAFSETNLPISLDLVVGIPAHIRKKLNVMDLSSSIKVDRDTTFILQKSINEQIVPILLTLFSTNLFTDSSVILSALLSVVAIPIVLYFNLSSKRNMKA